MAASTTPPRIDGFTFVRALGSGSTANVYLYRQINPSRLVAIKVSNESLDPAIAARFNTESEMMARLSSHPYILPVYGTGITSNGLGYIIFEYAPGGTYKELTQTEPLTCGQMLDLGVKLCGALVDAHRAGIIHHDIKTGNVLVTAQGLPALADFGISSTIYDKTFTGYSLPWASPEVLCGRTGREAADIYSLGATLYATLVGKSPFEYGYRPHTSSELRQLIIDSPVPPINRDDVPTDIDKALRRSMKKRPDDRYHSSLDFARELQRLQQKHFGHMTPVVAEGVPPYPAQQTTPSHKTIAETPKSRDWTKPVAITVSTTAALTILACLFAFVIAPHMDSASTDTRAQIITPATGNKSNGNEPGINPDDGNSVVVPSATNVQGKRNDDGTVTFTWTNPDPQKGDAYLWKPVQANGQVGVSSLVKDPTVTLEADKANGQICIQVSIVRANHQTSTEPSTACVAEQ